MIFSINFSFFFNDTATTEIYTLSLHDALPIYQKPEKIFNQGYKKTTNNRMELRACIKALEWIIKKNSFKDSDITRIIIFTDSLNYVCENQNRANYWKKKDWRNKYGRPMINSDLWNKFLLTEPKIKLRFDIEWIKRRSNSILIEVDNLAKKAAESYIRISDDGYIQGRVCTSKTHGEIADLFPAKGKKVIIRIYKHLPINKEEYEISFDLFSKRKNKLIRKYYAYASNEEKKEIHLRNYYKVEFNEDSKYPIFYVIEKIKDPSI